MEGVDTTGWVVVGVGIVTTVDVGSQVVIIGLGKVAGVMHFLPSVFKAWISAVSVCKWIITSDN